MSKIADETAADALQLDNIRVTRDNPLINATVRQMLWEVPINFPNSAKDHSGDTKPAIRKWMHKELEDWGWWRIGVRVAIIELVLVEFFGPEI